MKESRGVVANFKGQRASGYGSSVVLHIHVYLEGKLLRNNRVGPVSQRSHRPINRSIASVRRSLMGRHHFSATMKHTPDWYFVCRQLGPGLAWRISAARWQFSLNLLKGNLISWSEDGGGNRQSLHLVRASGYTRHQCGDDHMVGYEYCDPSNR